MTAKIICITLMFLASISSVFAEALMSLITGYAAEAFQAASVVPAVERRQGFIKRRLIIIC